MDAIFLLDYLNYEIINIQARSCGIYNIWRKSTCSQLLLHVELTIYRRNMFGVFELTASFIQVAQVTD